MRTRCKFSVQSVTRHGYAGPNGPVPAGETVKLTAIYGGISPEDVSFAEATPSGELSITVNNPAVVGTFVPGSCYYLDLIPVE